MPIKKESIEFVFLVMPKWLVDLNKILGNTYFKATNIEHHYTIGHYDINTQILTLSPLTRDYREVSIINADMYAGQKLDTMDKLQHVRNNFGIKIPKDKEHLILKHLAQGECDSMIYMKPQIIDRINLCRTITKKPAQIDVQVNGNVAKKWDELAKAIESPESIAQTAEAVAYTTRFPKKYHEPLNKFMEDITKENLNSNNVNFNALFNKHNFIVDTLSKELTKQHLFNQNHEAYLKQDWFVQIRASTKFMTKKLQN